MLAISAIDNLEKLADNFAPLAVGLSPGKKEIPILSNL